MLYGTVNPYVLGTIVPNPVIDTVTINYIAEDANSAYLIFTELNTNYTYNYILDTSASTIDVNMTSFNTGVYFVTLVCDGIAIDTGTLIKQ